jgi:hypothetical protein
VNLESETVKNEPQRTAQKRSTFLDSPRGNKPRIKNSRLSEIHEFHQTILADFSQFSEILSLESAAIQKSTIDSGRQF